MKTLSNYLVGFALSLALTLAAPALLYLHDPQLISSQMLAVVFVVLALLQLIVQLVCFLHLGSEKQSHANQLVFAFTLVIVVILVGGTLWIMANLNHTMTNTKFEGGVISPQTQRD